MKFGRKSTHTHYLEMRTVHGNPAYSFKLSSLFRISCRLRFFKKWQICAICRNSHIFRKCLTAELFWNDLTHASFKRVSCNVVTPIFIISKTIDSVDFVSRWNFSYLTVLIEMKCTDIKLSWKFHRVMSKY